MDILKISRSLSFASYCMYCLEMTGGCRDFPFILIAVIWYFINLFRLFLVETDYLFFLSHRSMMFEAMTL